MGQHLLSLLVQQAIGRHLQKWKAQLPLNIQPSTSKNDGDVDAYRF